MKARVLQLPGDLAASVLMAAARAYPRECCGLIEGTGTAGGWRVLAIHDAANVADEPARHFLIDPRVQFDILRRLRGTQTRIVGCFHSHPDGPPEPSAIDRANAFESDFLWLIAGGSPDGGFTLKAYRVLDEGSFCEVALGEA